MPRNVRAMQGENGVVITWEHDESGPPITFGLEVQPEGLDWGALGTVAYMPGQAQYSYTHENPIGASVRYRVRAVNEAGASAWAESNNLPLIVVPNVPTNVQAV
jgi:hypothetical protein